MNAVLNPVSLHRVDPFYLQAVWLLMRCGMPTLRHAVAGGQFQNPGGLFFGGTALEEGPAKLQSLMKERLSRAERVVAIDIHTGLGRYGEDRLLVDSAPQHASANQAMLQAYGDRMQLLNNASIAYPIRGAQQDMYYRLCPQAQVLFATQEFGTYHPLRVVKALRDENFWHSRGSSLDHPTKKTLVEMFNPADAKWRKTILSRGRRGN